MTSKINYKPLPPFFNARAGGVTSRIHRYFDKDSSCQSCNAKRIKASALKEVFLLTQTVGVSVFPLFRRSLVATTRLAYVGLATRPAAPSRSIYTITILELTRRRASGGRRVTTKRPTICSSIPKFNGSGRRRHRFRRRCSVAGFRKPAKFKTLRPIKMIC